MTRLPHVLKGLRTVLFVRLVANGLAQAAAAVATILLVRFIFDDMLHADQPTRGGVLALTGGGLLATSWLIAWLRMVERIDAERMGQDYAHKVRLLLFDRLGSATPRVLQQRSGGAVMLRFVGDLTALRKWVSLGLARVTVTGLTATLALLALSAVNWVLALAVGVSLAFGLLRNLGMGLEIKSKEMEARRRRGHLAANIHEKITAAAVVQAFGQTDRERRRLARQSRRLKFAMVARARTIGWMRVVTEGATGAAVAFVLFLGVQEVSSGRTSAGGVAAAMAIVGVLAPAIQGLGRVHEYYQSAQVSRKKILEFLKTLVLSIDPHAGTDLLPGPGRLEFDGVCLGETIQGVSGLVRPGRRVALVGPNGAGKSTLLALADRLVDPDSGRVLLDGQDLAKHSLSSVHRAIGMVSADLPLLRGTVAKNICYRWPDAPAEEVNRVCGLCGVTEVLENLPEGDQTRLQEGGSNLSFGQRQRIALARALLGNPVLLLLDEADANLDEEANLLFDRLLAEFRGTVLLVSHQAARIAGVDEIWYMEDGRLIETGPPATMQHRHRTGEASA